MLRPHLMVGELTPKERDVDFVIARGKSKIANSIVGRLSDFSVNRRFQFFKTVVNLRASISGFLFSFFGNFSQSSNL